MKRKFFTNTLIVHCLKVSPPLVSQLLTKTHTKSRNLKGINLIILTYLQKSAQINVRKKQFSFNMFANFVAKLFLMKVSNLSKLLVNLTSRTNPTFLPSLLTHTGPCLSPERV